MARVVFFTLLPLALLGDARILLFVVNRFVFGSHRHEHTPWKWLIWILPPILAVLTALFWPLHQWLRWFVAHDAVDLITPDSIERVIGSLFLAKLGGSWLLIAGGIGLYWVVDRMRLTFRGRPALAGVRTNPPEVIRLRKAHIPFAFLRNLGAHNDVYDIEVTRHEVFVGDLPRQFDGYRIVFLTDTHVAPFMRRAFFREVVEQSNRFQPDLVLLGGDFVTWARHVPLMSELLLTGLSACDGVFAVLGNHDYWAGARAIREAMEEKGVRFIINRSVRLRRDGAEIALAGIDEVYRGEPDPDAALRGIEASRPCIGLSHHPDIIDFLDEHRIDLLLCGHTHGGQIRVPLFGSIVVPSRHEARYASGFHLQERVLMYVSRGIGAVPPLRILCRPEVATFTLRTAGAAPTT